MDDKKMLLFLKKLRYSGKIDSLLQQGFELEQIANFTVIAMDYGYLDSNAEELKLTENGIKKIDELNTLFGKKSSERWLSTFDQAKIDKITENEIYIPKKRTIKKLC